MQIIGEFSKSTPLNLSQIIYKNDIEVLATVSDPSTGSTVANFAVVKIKRDEKMMWTIEPKRSNFQPGLPFTTFVSTLYVIFNYDTFSLLGKVAHILNAILM